MGLGEADIAELIRMATDERLNNADGNSPEVWAPVHAWRTLAQLRAVVAVEPLLGLLGKEYEWVEIDFPYGNVNDWTGGIARHY